MAQTETELERQARIAIEKHLVPLERLSAFTKADIVGLVRRQPYLVGLTQDRLILVLMDGGEVLDREVSIRLSRIRAVKWRSGIIRGFRVEIGRDTLHFRFGSTVTKETRIWVRRAKELVELLGKAVEHNPINKEVRRRISAERGENIEVQTGLLEGKPVLKGFRIQNIRSLLKQVSDFDTLGLQSDAVQELNEALSIQPALSMEPDVMALQKRLLGDAAAFKRAGLFLLIHAGIYLATVLLFLALREYGTDSRYLGRYLVPILGIELYAGIGLLRGQANSRSWALYWAGAWMFLTLLLFITDDSMFGSQRNLWEIVQGISFSLSVILPLTGSRSQQRMTAATVVFVLGYLVPSAIFIVVGLIL